MSLATLVEAVNKFAAATHHLTEHHLNQPSYRWDDYEQVRYAFLHTTLELRQLAVGLYLQRYRSGKYPTYAQHALNWHQQMYRECQALLTGISDEQATQLPAPHEWPLVTIVRHMLRTERYFYATIRNTLTAHINQEPAQPISEADVYALAEETGEPEAADAPLSELKQRWETLHNRIQYNLQNLGDVRLELASPMWESKVYPVRFRLHRFEAHLHEHVNQLEKTLIALNLLTEPRLLLRQMYHALGEVEGAILGAGVMGYSECMHAAALITDRIREVRMAVNQSESILAAVKNGDHEQVKALLAANPTLVNTNDSDGLFLVVKAAYNHDWEMVQILLEAGAFLDVHEAAAAGSLEQAQAWLAHSPDDLNAFSRDGFTPLQLACYFNHEALALYLLEQGADVSLVSQNGMTIQALHAAATHGNTVIVRALLVRGADPNATQMDNYIPMDEAKQNNDETLVELLKEYGATE